MLHKKVRVKKSLFIIKCFGLKMFYIISALIKMKGEKKYSRVKRCFNIHPAEFLPGATGTIEQENFLVDSFRFHGGCYL